MKGRPEMDSINKKVSRRAVLGAAALAAPAIWTGRAFGAEQITVADVGGAPALAIRKAFYDPFEKETGIRVVNVAHEPDPITQFKLLVDTRSYIWDLCMVTPSMVMYLTKPKEYLDPLNIAADEVKTLVPGMLTSTWFGFSVFCTILAYRTDKFPPDKFPNGGPQNWADFWNVAKFPGRRGLYKGVSGMLESALMADGVPADKLYPIDMDRAFKMLDRIKPSIKVWWTSGAQNTQLLQSGEVDMTDTWGGRAYAAIDSGAPVKMVWSQGLYSTDGWSIPKGTPRADLARKFVRYCMRAEQQAIYSNTVANAPTNQKAYDFITPERAKVLATSPENIKGLVPANDVWWAENRDKVQERFQDWLLG
jgi:putative spermidine/putrescine transport system substrate-binding protein